MCYSVVARACAQSFCKEEERVKLRIFFEKDRPQEVRAYLKEDGTFADRLRALCKEEDRPLVGYRGEEAVILDPMAVCCFITEEGKIFALTGRERLTVKSRLYQLEEELGQDFLKINQSCLASVKQIERFDASISGTLKVRFKNGYTDYVSRRCVKKVKERFGL